MTWVWFTLLNVLANGTVVALFKHETVKTSKPYSAIVTGAFIVATLVFLPYALYHNLVSDLQSITPLGFGYYASGLGLAGLATFLYMRAIKMVELSVIGPVENLRPFFVILFSFLILRQLPTPIQFIGIFLITLGAIVLNMKGKIKSQWLIHDRGVRLLLLCTIVFALSGIVDKLALSQMAPTTYAWLIMAGLTVVYGISYLLKEKRLRLASLFSPIIIISGLLYAVGFASIMIALSLSQPNLVVPLQMTRSLYLSLLGFWFLKEKDYPRKLFAAFLMLLGVWLIIQT